MVGHGSRAGDRERPPSCQDILLQPQGQDPSSQPHRVILPISPVLQPSASLLCRGEGFPEDFQAQKLSISRNF